MKFLRKNRNVPAAKGESGQALIEAAVAIPLLLALFAGCMVLIHIGIAHIVVQVSVFEAARQAQLADSSLAEGEITAKKICRAISNGATDFSFANGWYTVTHHLKTMFPFPLQVPITHSCPEYLFFTLGK